MIKEELQKIKKKYKKKFLETEIIVKPSFWDVPLRPTNLSFNNNLNNSIK